MSFKNYLLSRSRSIKKLLVLSTDFLSICLACSVAIYVSSVESNSIFLAELSRLIWIPSMSVFIFWRSGVYSSVVRYMDFSVIFILSKAIFFILILNIFINTLYYYFFSEKPFQIEGGFVPFEAWILGFMTATILIIGSRLAANFYFLKASSEKKVVIYGAGSAGIQLAGALKVSSEMQPIAFIDNNPSLHNTFLGGIKIFPPKKLEYLIKRGKVDEVLIAMPSASKSTLKLLLKKIENYSIKVRILPGLAELAQGKILVSELKEVEVSDLLGRYEVEANQDLINRNIKDKTVLITGAGGSIGSEIARQVCNNKPKKVIILDSSEYFLYSIKKELETVIAHEKLFSILANVTNKKRISEICKVFEVDTIYHAAAYKHVPLVEENPFEGLVNNVFGTQACALAAIESQVETFVLISTDKAVRPTNIMGATKRFSEMILQALSEEGHSKNNTRMTMVRFGNVLGSSGSALPLFQKQIRDGGPITVTDPEVIRYFMSISEAAELVIQAGAMGKGGDVFVLDMGEPVKILELAKKLINLSGMQIKDDNNLSGDIEIVFTGLRPGEKLYEELLIGDNVSTTMHKQILRAEEDFLPQVELEKFINLLREAEEKGDTELLKRIFQEVVHGFSPNIDNTEILSVEKNKYNI